jgi:hypothetical protein
MIISYKHKYIFVGIPFSASSTISKELLEKYEGEFILNKHTNIPTLIDKLKINIDEFIVFGVYRSPVEILKSRYNKLRNNPDNRFTDDKYTIKNGGYVPERVRKLSKIIRENNLSFEDYLNLNFKLFPYNNEFTINAPYLNYIVDFNNLEEDFQKVLSKIGVVDVNKIEKINETKKRSDIEYFISDDKMSKFIAPFLVYNSKYIPNYTKQKVNKIFYLIFLLTNKLREKRTLKADNHRSLKNDVHFSENIFLQNKDKL